MNTQNSKTHESNKFIYQFTDKLNFKNPNKNMVLANLSITIQGRTLNLNTTALNLIHLPQLDVTLIIATGSYKNEIFT